MQFNVDLVVRSKICSRISTKLCPSHSSRLIPYAWKKLSNFLFFESFHIWKSTKWRTNCTPSYATHGQGDRHLGLLRCLLFSAASKTIPFRGDWSFSFKIDFGAVLEWKISCISLPWCFSMNGRLPWARFSAIYDANLVCDNPISSIIPKIRVLQLSKSGKWIAFSSCARQRGVECVCVCMCMYVYVCVCVWVKR